MGHKPSEQASEPDPRSSDLVPVVFAANRTEAEFYQTLLADADIRADIDTDVDEQSGQVGKGVPVLVPHERLDEASDVITVREEMEAHILAGPDDRDREDEDEEELTATQPDDDTVEEEDLLFRRDPFLDDEGAY